MAAKKGAIALTESQFASELVKRLELEGTDAANLKVAKAFISAFKAEVTDCLANGYKVTFNGFARFEPKYVPEKAKGELVRNPGTGEMVKRAKGEPASFKAKAFMSSSVAKFFPTTRTAAGQALAAQLAPPAKKKTSAKRK